MIVVKDFCNINEEKFRYPWLPQSILKESCCRIVNASMSFLDGKLGSPSQELNGSILI